MLSHEETLVCPLAIERFVAIEPRERTRPAIQFPEFAVDTTDIGVYRARIATQIEQASAYRGAADPASAAHFIEQVVRLLPSHERAVHEQANPAAGRDPGRPS